MDNYPVIGGSGGGGGAVTQAPDAPDTLASTSTAEVIEAICEGEIEGFATADPLQCIYLNGTPLRTGTTDNFKKVSTDYRLGTQSQTAMLAKAPLSNSSAAAGGKSVDPNSPQSTSHTTSINTVLTKANPIVRTITSTIADSAVITLRLGYLYSLRDDGSKAGASITVAVSVTTSNYTAVNVELPKDGIIKGKTEASYDVSFPIDLKAIDPNTDTYQITLKQLTNDFTAASHKYTTIQWLNLTEVTHARLRYPNTVVVKSTFDAKSFSSVPSRGYLLKGKKVRVPNSAAYNPVSRIYSGAIWDGTFTVAWTRNPVWILLDLITSKRYGLGNEIDQSLIDQNRWGLYTIAKRCDELVPDGFGGTEHRYSCDLFIQTDNDAKKVMMDIASSFDAMIFWTRSSIFLSQDAPKTVTAIFTPSNVIDGLFVYAGSARQTRYTAALVQWNDPADNYAIATEYVDDPEGVKRYGYQEIQMAAIGCTSRGQAHRAGKRVLLTSRLETDTVTFSTGMNGISLNPGDVIRVSDPLRNNQKRLGGRIHSVQTSKIFTADNEVLIDQNALYSCAVIMSDGSVATSPVTSISGTTVTLAQDLHFTPDVDAVFVIYQQADIAQVYRILSISVKDGEQYVITAVTYNESKYSLTDSIAQLPPLPIIPYANTNYVLPPSELQVSDGVYYGLHGIQRYIDISWAASQDPLVSNYVVFWSVDDGSKTAIQVMGLTYRIEGPVTGTYSISVGAVNMIGAKSNEIGTSYVLGDFYQITAVHVTDLHMPSNTLEFTGKDASFTWATDAEEVLNMLGTYGAGAGGQTPWFRDFEINVYKGATLLRTEFVTGQAYRYTYNKNSDDNAGNPTRSFTVTVKARDYYGRYSQSASISVSNPEPNASGYTGFTLSPGAGSIFVEYAPPDDADYVSTRIYASQTTGFTPGAANLKQDTAQRVSSFPAINGNWYVRLQGVDDFGPATSYSTEFHTNVIAADIGDSVNTLLADPGRTGDFVVEADRFLVVPAGQTAPKKAMFGMGYVDGVYEVGLRGNLLIDGTVAANSLIAHSITSDYLHITQGLSSVSADIGFCNAGTFSTNVAGYNGWRLDLSTIASSADGVKYPIWYGNGAKTAANGKFYLDTAGNAYFGGTLNGATGIFSGLLSGGSINVNNRFTVASDGTVTIKDAVGNVMFASGTGITGANAFDTGTLGSGKNMILNSDLAVNDYDQWYVEWAEYGTAGSNAPYYDLAGVSWNPVAGHSIGFYRDIVGGIASASATGWFDLTKKPYYSVSPGQRYEASAYLQAHRNTPYVVIKGYKNNGGGVYTFVTDLYSSLPFTAPQVQNLRYQEWYRGGGFFTIPNNGTIDTVRISLRGSAQTDSTAGLYTWGTHFYLGPAGSTQIALSPWVPGQNMLTAADTGSAIASDNTALLNILQKWSEVGSKPLNVAGLTGLEKINNSLVTINPNGTLNNAGGGAVSLSGIGFNGHPNATSNTGAFANLQGLLTQLNIGTYIESLAISRAYIGDLHVTTADIDDLQVSTLKIAQHSVSALRVSMGNKVGTINATGQASAPPGYHVVYNIDMPAVPAYTRYFGSGVGIQITGSVKCGAAFSNVYTIVLISTNNGVSWFTTGSGAISIVNMDGYYTTVALTDFYQPGGDDAFKIAVGVKVVHQLGDGSPVPGCDFRFGMTIQDAYR